MTDDANRTDEPTANEDILEAENRRLRERVDALEDALAEIQDELGTASTTEDAHTAATTDDEKPVMTGGGRNCKVIGKLDDTSGVGVYGENTAGSGTNYGVEGVMNSSKFDAAGVYARSTGSGYGLQADSPSIAVGAFSTGTYGVYTQTDAEGGIAVNALSLADSGQQGIGVNARADADVDDTHGVRGTATAASGKTAGVYGATDSRSDGAAGVEGKADGASGTTYGVKGSTRSPEGYGLYTPDRARVDGTMTVGTLGATAYLSNNQTISGDGSRETVTFDTVTVDDFGNAFNDTTGEFTVPEAGDYHVSTTVHTLSDIQFGLYIVVGNNVTAQMVRNTKSGSLSKILRGLSSNVTITIGVAQATSQDEDLVGKAEETYVTIDRIG